MISVIKAGLLIDGTGSRLVRDATLIVENGWIKEIAHDTAAIPPGATVYDASAYNVIPGLIDIHTHLGYPSVSSLVLFRVSTQPTLAVLYAAQSAQASLAAGFTTLRTMGGPEFVSLRQAIDQGLLPGPRLVIAGIVAMSGGHTDRLYPPNYSRGSDHTADGVDEIRQRVRQFVRNGVDVIKVEATGGMIADGDTPDIQGYGFQELAAAAEAAHGLGKRLAVHAHSSEGVRNAAEAGADTIEHCTWADEQVLELVARKNIFITATCSIVEDSIRRFEQARQLPPDIDRRRAALEGKLRMLANARKMGVKVALGTDACGVSVHHGQNALEFELLCRAGFTPMESLLAGTQVAANALGLGDQVGTLEAGKQADLVVLTSNPLQDITSLQNQSNVLQVFKGGQLVVDRLSEPGKAWLRWSI